MHILNLNPPGSYYARPVNGHLGAPRPFPGSTASSSNSSRNDSPSPTSSNDDSGIHGGPGPYSNGLSRPSKFAAKSSVAAGNAAPSAASAIPVSSLDQNGGMICVGCKKPMSAGDVVVKAERAGAGKFWHPGCFKCDTCKVRDFMNELPCDCPIRVVQVTVKLSYSS